MSRPMGPPGHLEHPAGLDLDLVPACTYHDLNDPNCGSCEELLETWSCPSCGGTSAHLTDACPVWAAGARVAEVELP